MMDYDELARLMSDPDDAVRCPECLWTHVEVLSMHPRTGATYYECTKCYTEFSN